jgi:uncharacterized protein YidB (DUF937 family)
MDMNDIINMGTEMFQNKLADQAEGLDNSSITDALNGLLSNEEGSFDISSIASNAMSSEGIGSIVSSWLGDGNNEEIDAGGLASLLGEDKISAFADKLGIDTDTALSGLTDAIPNMMDKSSEGGSIVDSLLDSMGGAEGVMNMVGKFFNK